MKKIIITILCICLADIPLMAEIRLMNTTNVLKNYGFKDGEFRLGEDPIYKLPFKARVEYGKIEEEASVDTQEEFLTAAYYSPIKIEYKAQAAIDKELPKGREGALRLGAMWLIKLAEKPENGLQYKKAIDMICAQSNVTRAEIDKYYAEAIRKKIYETPINSPVTKDEANQARELLLTYTLTPTEKNIRQFLGYQLQLALDDKNKSTALTSFVDKVSPAITFKLLRIMLGNN